MVLYFNTRSFKIILSRRPPPTEGVKMSVRTVVMTTTTVGRVFCAKGDDAVRLLATCSNEVVLQSDEAVACFLLLFPPSFGKTALGLGDTNSSNVPFTGATSSPIFLCVARQREIDAMVEGLVAFLGPNNDIYCSSPITWPSSYHDEEMARQRVKAEAEKTGAGSFESNTMSEDHQERVDKVLMSLSKRHFRHLMGVRKFYLKQLDYKDPLAMWWWGAWVTEYTMEVLAEMFKESAMRLCLPERLKRNLTAENLTAICLGCGATIKVEFNGTITVDGRDHSDCTGPLANKIHNELVKARAVSGGNEGQVISKPASCFKANISIKSPLMGFILQGIQVNFAWVLCAVCVLIARC